MIYLETVFEYSLRHYLHISYCYRCNTTFKLLYRISGTQSNYKYLLSAISVFLIMKQHPKNENNMTHKHGIKHNIHHHGTINVFAYHVGFQVKYHCWQFIKHLDVSFGGKINFLNVSYKNTFRTEKKNEWNPRYFSFLTLCAHYIKCTLLFIEFSLFSYY